MAQPIFQFPENTPICCACTEYSLNDIPKDQRAFAVASCLFGKLYCEGDDCSPDSPDSANAGLDLCTVTQDLEGRFALPLGGLLKCCFCESETALGNIASQNQFASILEAFVGNYKCQDCKEKESKPLTPKECVMEWLKQHGCYYESEIKKLLADLLRAMDVFYPPGTENGFAVVTNGFQDDTAIFSPTLESKGGELKRFVLVRRKEESSAVLWKLYSALSHAEKSYSTAAYQKSRALSEREIDLKKAERNLFEALRGLLIQKEAESVGVEALEFSVDLSVSEALIEAPLDERKRGREEECVVIDLVSSEEEKKKRNRTSTVGLARLFLNRLVGTKIAAKQMSWALQNRGGEVVQHCSKRGVTVLRLCYATADYLLSNYVLEKSRVSPPFDSNQELISRKKHFVLVVLDDIQKRIYDAVRERRELVENQENRGELFHLIYSTQESIYLGESIPLDQEILEQARFPILNQSWSPFQEALNLDNLSI
jgi:hypothetical protein